MESRPTNTALSQELHGGNKAALVHAVSAAERFATGFPEGCVGNLHKMSLQIQTRRGGGEEEAAGGPLQRTSFDTLNALAVSPAEAKTRCATFRSILNKNNSNNATPL